MTELSPQAQRLVHLARGADDPDELTRLRVEHGLATRIALGAGTAGAATALTTGAGGSTMPLAVKAIVALGLTAGLGGVWTVREHLQVGAAPSTVASGARSGVPGTGIGETRSVDSPGAARGPATLAAPPLTTTPAGPPEPVERVSPPPSPAKTAPLGPARADTASESDAPSGDRPSSAAFPVTSSERVRAELQAPATADAAPEPDPLRAETAALRAAQGALRSGDARRALALLDEQDERFRAGSLQEERAAARVLALCQAYGPEGVRGAAERFEQRFPQSALLARVRSACRDRPAPATQDSIPRK